MCHPDDKYYNPPYYQSFNKFSEWTPPPPPPKYSHSHSKQKRILTENVSSGDESMGFIDDKTFARDLHKLQKSSSKKSSHRKEKNTSNSSNSKTKRKYSDDYDDNKELKFERRKDKRRRSDRIPRRLRTYSSSDDDCIEITNREELKAALNLGRTESLGSTLEQKLIASQKTEMQSKKFDKHKKHVFKINNKKSVPTKRGKKMVDDITKDPIIEAAQLDNADSCVYTASKEISDLFKSLKQEKLLDTNSKKINVIEQQLRDVCDAADNDDEVDDDDEDDDDETVSLEEQELRLIALKSAVMKKHEARKKRRVEDGDRPYSPTDILLTPDRFSEIDDHVNTDITNFDNNNMEISPAMSPNALNIKASECQPMDMEIALSDESKSPIFFYDKTPITPNEEKRVNCDRISKTNDHLIIAKCNKSTENQDDLILVKPLPIVINKSEILSPNEDRVVPCHEAIPIDSESDNKVETISVGDDDETALRALLIANMKATIKTEPKPVICSQPKSITKAPAFIEQPTDINKEDDHMDEADCLRSQLLSSMSNRKEATASKRKYTDNSTPTFNSLSKPLVEPPLKKGHELTNGITNLREALKRFQNKSTSKDASTVDIKSKTHSVINIQKSDINKSVDPDVLKSLCAKLVANNSHIDEKLKTPLSTMPPPQTKEEPLFAELDEKMVELTPAGTVVNNKIIEKMDDCEENNSNNKNQSVEANGTIGGNILTPANKLPLRNVSFKIEAKNTQKLSTVGAVANLSVIGSQSVAKAKSIPKPNITAKSSSVIQSNPKTITVQCTKPAASKALPLQKASKQPILQATKPTGIVSIATKIAATRITIKNSPDQKINITPKAIKRINHVSLVTTKSTALSMPTKPIATTATTSTSAPTTPRTNSITLSADTKIKTPSSKVILIPEPKPVQKLIISINQSDSSSESYDDNDDGSDNDDTTNIDGANDNTVAGFNKSLRSYNASPSSTAMGSPSFAPSSPAGEFYTYMENNKDFAIDEKPNNTEIIDKTDDSKKTVVSEANTAAFQLKLDEYLKKVRATVAKDDDPVPRPVPKQPITVGKLTEKKTIVNKSPVTPQKTPVVSNN